MYARVTSARTSPENVDETIRLWRDSVIPAAKQQKGFKSARFLVDRKTGKAVTLAFWETEADALATGERSVYMQEILAKFASLLIGPTVMEHYEVAVDV